MAESMLLLVFCLLLVAGAIIKAERQKASNSEAKVNAATIEIDPQVGRALALIHQNSGRQWSAVALASEVAMSRSAFVERFTALVGMPPIRYLTLWRLQAAKLNLIETHMNVAQLAHSVGYDSEEAFSRAFKREFGLPPAKWREQQMLGNGHHS